MPYLISQSSSRFGFVTLTSRNFWFRSHNISSCLTYKTLQTILFRRHDIYQHTVSTNIQHINTQTVIFTNRPTQGADNPLTVALQFCCHRAHHLAAQVLVQVEDVPIRSAGGLRHQPETVIDCNICFVTKGCKTQQKYIVNNSEFEWCDLISRATQRSFTPFAL